MPTYMMLVQWTESGIENVKKLPDRLAECKGMAGGLGVEMKQFYMLMGHRYDIGVIVEAPSDEAMATFVLGIGSEGYARTESLRAFTEEECGRILEAVP